MKKIIPTLTQNNNRILAKRIAVLLLLFPLIITQTSCASFLSRTLEVTPDPVVKEDFMLDTTCKISLYRVINEEGKIAYAVEEKEQSEAAMESAFDKCRELEQLLSKTIEDSDVAKINSAGGEWVEVSDYTLELIKKGIDYAKLSGGAFDITIGGLTNLWDFHADAGDAKLPDEEDLAEAVKHVGYENIEIDGNRVRLKDPKTQLDLGGIAKGYIGDRMTEVLEESGVKSAIVNLGGNVICIGGKDDGVSFNIGIETPYSDGMGMLGTVEAEDNTVVTSGIYERKIEVDGKSYHHILDVKTGWPVETDLDAVSIKYVKGYSADADAFSTICLIKGYEEGLKLLEEESNAEAAFMLKNGELKETLGMKIDRSNAE